MPRRNISLIASLLLFCGFAASTSAQVTSIAPRTCPPGATTELAIIGTNLDQSLRFVSSSPSAEIRILSVEPTRAIAQLSLPADETPGPLGLWIASAAGPLPPQIVIVDDLVAVQDNGKNHSLETAQPVDTLVAIDGRCDAACSDHYRVSVTAGQRVAFEIHTQAIHSAMDPVMHILDAAGNQLLSIDDDSMGPDFRFSYQFPSAGDYVLQIHDNRFSAAGSYYLRVGDFPIVQHAFPLAIQRANQQRLEFVTSDRCAAAAIDVELPLTFIGNHIRVAAHSSEGKSSAWATAIVSDFDQVVEPVTPTEAAQTPLSIPIGISGRLTEAGQRDAFNLLGTKGQQIRISSRTLSLGCPTLLKMQLFDTESNKLAETVVSESDEWALDYTFPEDGKYRLEVSDLLGRGGTGFAYWIEIKPAGSFQVALKADAATKDLFAMQGDNGACAIDLQVNRFGYAGEIHLALANPIEGVHIINSRLPPNSTEATVYLVADQNWDPGSLEVVRLLATAADGSASTMVTSDAMRRLKEPSMLVPAAWRDGTLALAGVAKTDSPFLVESTKPLQFARPITNHAASFTLKRLDESFKSGVTVIPLGLPTNWTASAKLDKDSLSVDFSRSSSSSEEPQQVSLSVFAEHAGRGRVETLQCPIEWIDPVLITLESLGSMVPGRQTTVTAKVQRQGGDPQPVIIRLSDLPPGLTGPESITVAADQSELQFQLEVSPDAVPQPDFPIQLIASSSYGGVDFTISSNSIPFNLIELPERIEVFPAAITLSGARARRQLVVSGFDRNDSPRDWTHDARITVADDRIATVDGSVVYPKSDGETEIEIVVGGRRQTIPVHVANVQTMAPTAFESEVLVALSKQGCNSGACHGSPSGKGEFRLSLRAFDKRLDELTLIREDFGRRVNPLDPQRSLLLQKPTMGVAHGGGKRLQTDDEAYRILHRWISEGAQADPEGTPRCDRLEVFPNQKRVLACSCGGQQLVAIAHLTDGTDHDVTHLVAYSSSNTNVATIDDHGLVTPHEQGETVILVRYLEHIEAVPLMFVDQAEEFQWQAPAANNYIDQLVDAKLQLLQYLPSELCTDSEFLRRVHLDVIGILPTVDQTRAFLADTDSKKRARLIDQLLQRDEYAKFWALKWGDLLRMTASMVGDEGVFKYHRWVEQSLRDNMPYDQFATQLLTASGSTLSNPPANFYRTAADMNECVETISQVFLGARLQCAKCHNHPFERWTQDNYYGLGAFFHRVQRRKTPRPGELFIYDSDSGDVTQPRTGQKMQPWLPLLGDLAADDDLDRRQQFASWLVNADNPFFARIEANRIWSQLFARGIVDPIDDFRESNPPSNAPLLDALTKDFIDSGYNRKHLLRTILNSRTYQTSYQSNESNRQDSQYFSHQEPRLLSAEQLLDAINQTLGLSQNFGNLPSGTKATQLPAPDVAKVDFLKTFGQPERRTVCACERGGESNLGMAIELFNGAEIHNKLRDPGNRFRVSLAAGNSPEQTIRELYIAALCRQPSAAELDAALQHCSSRDDRAAGVEDVCWAILNTDEFVFQH